MSRLQKFCLFFLPWLCWMVGVTFYCHQFILRVSVASLTPELKSQFHINALSLANITVSFYYAFIVTQIFSGVLIDKFGARLMLTLATLLCALGSFLFAHAQSVVGLEVSRVFIGSGAAFALIGTLTIARQWFDDKYFVILNGLTIATGTLGAFIGEGPLASLITHFAWQHIFMGFSIIAVIQALLIWLIVRDRPLATNEKTSSPPILRTIGTPSIWLCGLFAGSLYVPINAFGALWATPFLISLGLAAVTAANVSSCLFIGVSVGCLMAAFVANYWPNIISLMRLFTLSAFVILAIILYAPRLANIYYFILFFMLGVSVSGFSLAFVLVSRYASNATAFSLTNVLKLLIGSVLLEVIGLLLDHYQSLHHILGHNAQAFHYALSVILISLGCALILTFFLKTQP